MNEMCITQRLITACLVDCKNYNKSTGLDFWLCEAPKYTLLAPLAQDSSFSGICRARIFRMWWLNYWEKESPHK